MSDVMARAREWLSDAEAIGIDVDVTESYIGVIRDLVRKVDDMEAELAEARRDAVAYKQELENIANARPATNGDDWRDQFQEWAQSRARHILFAIDAARSKG